MCSICYKNPCDPRCPNAPEPPQVGTCKICEEPIYDGDEVYEMDGEQYHCDCFTDNAVDILVSECGAFYTVAEAREDF